MKKIVMMVAVATLSLSFMACGGKKESGSQDNTQTQAPKANDSQSSTTTTTVEGSVLDKYDNFVDKYIVVFQKVQKGDVPAIQELNKLNEEFAGFQETLMKEMENMDEAQQKKYEEIAKKFEAAVNQAN